MHLKYYGLCMLRVFQISMIFCCCLPNEPYIFLPLFCSIYYEFHRHQIHLVVDTLTLKYMSEI